MDGNLIFQHILGNIYILKKHFKPSLQYLEHELRHLCPLNPSQTPEKKRWVQNEPRHL